jgi:uncharacterized protein (DUF1330 family)
MAAYLIAFAKARNAARMAEYSGAAGPTIVSAGGSVVTRGKIHSLAGSFSADACLIVKFSDVQAAKAWYQSPAYQALIPLRDEVMEPNFLILEEPAA